MEKGTSSWASSGSLYEVFLNFRGSDTRYTFTDFLYQGLKNAGILVFRDSESLHIGEKIGELLHAIENSKIYIPIFSKNYASSDWCLRELAHMVKCKSNGNKEILPIFLDVEPDDVKLKTKRYRQTLSQRQKTCSEVKSWTKALIEVGQIKGWNWKPDESQADLMKSVIQAVQDKLNAEYKKIVTEDLVGIDDRVKDIINRLDVGSDSVQFLGIHGMGGIGKTTLAKVVFNQLSPHFKYRNFLSNVRESSESKGLPHLQKLLLSKFPDFCSNLDQIHDTDDGINTIKRVLGYRKVLIVLDDVDEIEQLKNLVAKGACFGSSSRIIITTRDQSILRIGGEVTGEGLAKKSVKVSTYEVCEMKFDDALKLLSRHAFGSYSPPKQYLSLSKEVVSTLGNLPLALEVVGSSLRNEPIEIWKATLKKLKDAPPQEVQSKLIISYDKLEKEQKEVFLDIACFFVNKDKTYPSYMWDACGYHPVIAIKVLILRSLIKIKDDDTFWMHDQVRDLGREIVHLENEDPCKRSRLWNRENAMNILKRKEGSKEIKALSLGSHRRLWNLEYFPYIPKLKEGSKEIEALSLGCHKDVMRRGEILRSDEFVDLQNLRFLQGEGMFLYGDFNNLLSHLRWLSCRQCYTLSGAKNLHLTDLVVLDLSGSKISEEDIVWIKEARKLKVLDLSCCYNLRRIPDLSTLVSLEILRLHDCWKMEKLPDSIGELQSLIELNLEGTGIDHLPDSFGNLNKLTTLRMSDIEGGMKKLPSAIWLVHFIIGTPVWSRANLVLHRLKIPDLSWTQISGLPTVASLISNIHKLEIAAWGSIQAWDSAREFLGKLENVIAIPAELHTPSQMEKRILASPNMRFLLHLPSSIRESVFRELATTLPGCYYVGWRLEGSCQYWMPIFLGVSNSELEKLHMQDCTFSRRLALFYSKIRRLTTSRSRPPPLPPFRVEFLKKALEPSHMQNLQEVDLFECERLVEIRGLEELGSLSSLAVTYCRLIERMPDLSKSRKLRELRVGKCPKLRSVEGLNRLESLKRLRIHDCRSLESSADTSNLDLECCLIVRCKRLSDHRSCCKRGRGCCCEMLSEGLRKSDPMEARQVLQGHPNVEPVRKSELDWVVVLGVAIWLVLLVSFCFFVF